jgi:hypothetical protein
MTAPSAALRNAINEAEFLLKFVAERKGTPAPDIVEAVEVARSAIETGSIDGRQETAFWAAYSQLSRRAAPATIDSLRYVANMNDRKTPMARALRWLRRYTILTFIILTGLQIYWTMMSSMVSDVTRMNDEINAIVQNVRYAGEADEKKRNSSDLGIRLGLLQKRAWSVYETMYCVSPIYVGVRCWWWRDSTQRRIEIYNLYTDSVIPTYTDDVLVNNARNFIEQTARLTLQVISIYFLPLLYGTLGAGVYVLRRFTYHLDRLTFTEATHRRYRIRLMLGGIFGLAIGVMCTSEQTSTLFGAYSPFFISFLAGYSVEGVFAALDSVILSMRERLQPGADSAASASAPVSPPRSGGAPGKNGNGTAVVHPAVARSRAAAAGARSEAAE